MDAPNFIAKNHRYRPDIDLLRAIAVGSVVVFHAGVDSIPGGFVGVDIFFVISGYLISKHLIEEANCTGRVNILGFFERRLRRIGPVLLAVLTVTTIAAMLTLFPPQLEAYFVSLATAIGLVSNFFFWSQSGYFAAQASTVPLLHTWSLAVEEQFYICVPLLVVLCARRPRLLRMATLAAFGTSLALSVWQSELRPGASFYLLPMRAWELLLGTLVAQAVLDERRVLTLLPPQAWATIGLATIAASLFVIDETMPFPDAVALLPCLGTAMVLIGGRNRMPSIVAPLACQPVLHLGLISYSLYLWHWPVLVFWQYFLPSEPDLGTTLGMIALSYVLAVTSWKFIELPTRSHKMPVRRIGIMMSGGVATLAVAAAIGIGSGGFPQRFSVETTRLAAATEDRSPWPQSCRMDLPECHLGSKGPPQIVLVGDSYAGALAPAFDAALARHGLAGVLLSQNSCPPLFNHRPTGGSKIDAELCQQRNTEGLQSIAARKSINDVYLMAANYGGADGLAALERVIALFNNSGKRVTVLYGLPRSENGTDLPLALAKAEAFGTRPPNMIRQSEPVAQFARRFAGDPAIRFIDLSAALCHADDCVSTIAGQPIYSDAGHLTASVSRTHFADFLSPHVSQPYR